MEKLPFLIQDHKIYVDKKRHLICVPYEVLDLHVVAAVLDIDRCWYHSKPYPHYDIPKRRVDEILNRPDVNVISSKELLKIIKESM